MSKALKKSKTPHTLPIDDINIIIYEYLFGSNDLDILTTKK